MITSQIALTIQKRYAVDAQRMVKAVEIVNKNQLKRLASGNYAVVSQSNPHLNYSINPTYETCNCPDGSDIVRYEKGVRIVERAARLCKHYVAYLLMRELGRVLIKRAAQAQKIDGLDRSEFITTQRELIARAKRDAMKRTEWVEELDHV